jgi:hypothetical protein
MLDEAMTRHHPDSPVCRLVYLLVLLDRPLWSVACVWADPIGGSEDGGRILFSGFQ